MTLVEVLAALVILGVILSSLLVARARCVHQTALAARKLEAVKVADHLLADWWARPREEFPRHGRGAIAAQFPFAWQTQVVARAPFELQDLEVVRLEVRDDDGTLGSEPLVRTEIVLPIADRPRALRQEQR